MESIEQAAEVVGWVLMWSLVIAGITLIVLYFVGVCINDRRNKEEMFRCKNRQDEIYMQREYGEHLNLRIESLKTSMEQLKQLATNRELNRMDPIGRKIELD